MREAAALNHPVQCIKVACADGVEFVVVAARAGDGHSLEGFADDVNLVVDDFGLVRADVHRGVAVLAEPPPRGSEAAFVPAAVLGKPRFDLVAGNVLFHKAVVRHVVIKRANHIIAIAPHFLILEIKFVAKRFRVAHEIQPMPPPAFSEMRRSKQAVDEIFDCQLPIADCGLLEGRDGLRARRQSGEVKIRASDERAIGGGASGFDAFGLQLRENKMVNWRCRPIALLHFGRRLLVHWLPRPVFCFAFCEIEFFLSAARHGFLGPRRTAFHPFVEVGDLLAGQLPARGHFQIHIVIANGLDEAALLRLAQNN